MLNTFNKYIYDYLAGTDTENKKYTDEQISNFNTNEFFYRYVQPVADESETVATKQRENTFIVFGKFKDVKKFFSGLKVDSEYMNTRPFAEEFDEPIANPVEFEIYDPIFTFGDIHYNLKYDQDYPVWHNERIAPQTHEIDNYTRKTIHGFWFPFYEDETESARKIKAVKPVDFIKHLDDIKNIADIEQDADADESMLYVEFQVNCDRRANQVDGEMSEYAKDPDEMNEFHNEEPPEFDYTQLNIKEKR